MAPSNSILIGLDFGTTFSGVAWCWAQAASPEDIHVITDWESCYERASDLEKVPSALHYHDADISTVRSDNVTNTWGWGIPLRFNALRWFKLLLLEPNDLPPEVREYAYLADARQRLADEDRDPVEVVADYLRRLWRHALANIESEVGETVLSQTNLKIRMTVPAIWPAYALARMRDAASLADMTQQRGNCEPTTLGFVNEPEAAALASTADLKRECRLDAGDTFTMVDAGGGTVDLISYKVKSTQPFALEEVVEGQGGLCGAKFLDEDFERELIKFLGEENYAKIFHRSRVEGLHQCWECGIKRSFTGGSQDWTLPLAFERAWSASSHAEYVDPPKMPANRVKAVFEPTMANIEALVQSQISKMKGKPPKYLLLVGGFGRSKYLRRRLDDLVKPQGTVVLQARDSKPWTAICRGAVIAEGISSGFMDGTVFPKVALRKARMNYGLAKCSKWDPVKHDPRDKIFHRTFEDYYANNQMDWFIKRGENIIGRPETKLRYRLGFKTTESLAETRVLTIYQSDDINPPPRMEPSVHTLDKLNWSCPRPDYDLPLETTPLGNLVRIVNYDVKITIVGQAAEAAVTCHGQQTGGLKFNLDPEKSMWDPVATSATPLHSGWELPGATGAKTVRGRGKGGGQSKTSTKSGNKNRSKDTETDDDQDYE